MRQATTGPSGKGARIALLLAAVFALAAVLTLAGCSEKKSGSGMQKKEEAKATSAAPPKAKDDHATTVEEREVQIKMVANDSGRSLQIDKAVSSGHGDIICEAGIETGKIRSCAYTPVKSFSGTDKFEYIVKDKAGRTDSAMVYIEVKPAK